MSETIVWIHEDALGGQHSAYHGHDLRERGFFVWDEAYLRRMKYGTKRLVFIYETLCEWGVPIFRGDTCEVALALARSKGAETVLMAETPNPELMTVAQTIAAEMRVESVPAEAFVALETKPSLRRFFAYWKKAKPILLRD